MPLVTVVLLLGGGLSPGEPGSPSGRTQADADSSLIWVFLTDKGVQADRLAPALARARSLYAPRALARRQARGTVSDLTYQDLPVAEAYVTALRESGLRVRRTSRWLNAVSGAVAQADLPRLRSLPGVERIQPLGRGRRPVLQGSISRAPGLDPETSPGQESDFGPSFYGQSWAQNLLHQVPELHAAGLTGAGVVVGLMDSGFRTSHRVFEGLEVVAAYDFVDDDDQVQGKPGEDHGTVVWSAMAGTWTGRLVGPAFGASFLLARTEDVNDEYQGEEDNWVAALEWMEMLGVDVTNTSLGYIDWYAYSDMDGNTAVTTVAADAASARGVMMIVSAGNTGNMSPPASDDQLEFGYYIGAPADGRGVIAAGATWGSGERWSHSSRGPTYDGRIKPDLMAQGVNVACAVIATGDSALGTASGTSLSAPLVTGAVALLLEAHPDWNPLQMREALRETADRLLNSPPGTPDNAYGWGSLRGGAARHYSSEPPVEDQALAFYNYPNPFSEHTAFMVTVPGAGPVTIRIFNAAGVRVRELSLLTGYAGTFSVVWDARNQQGHRVAPGVYFAVAEFEGQRARAHLLRRP